MEVTPYSPSDLEDLLSNFDMRKIDREELLAQSGLEPYESLQEALKLSTYAWVARIEGKPVGVGGVVYPEDGGGVPWFVRSEELFNKRLFEANTYILGALDLFLTKTHYLANFVAEDNKDTIRWLKFLGFTVTDDRYILQDPDKVFYHFYMVKGQQ